MGLKKYNKMDNIVNLLYRAYYKDDGWGIYWSKNRVIFCVSPFGIILITQQLQR